MKVVLYTQPGCYDCQAAENAFRSWGVSFEKKNIREDEEALGELLAMGSRVTPTIVIDGLVFEGFLSHRDEVRAALRGQMGPG